MTTAYCKEEWVMARFINICLFSVAILFFTTSFSYGTVVTYFQSTDIGGGIYASSTATVTTGAGYVDVIIQNTSPLGPQIAGEYANPFISELEFTFPNGLMVDTANSGVTSVAGSYFSQGTGTALYSAASRTLNYDVVDRDDPHGLMKKCLMSNAEVGNNQNDNTTASINVLDGLKIPREGHAIGFLNAHPDTYSGAIFDAVTYHIAFEQTGVIVPESFYTEVDRLVVKYKGGGGFSLHVYNVPEPATICLLGFGVLALLKKRRA